MLIILKKNIAIIIITLIALLLRIYGLDFESPWNDELSSIRRSTQENLFDLFRIGILTEVHPPLFHLIMYYYLKITGTNIFWCRFLSAITGTVSVLYIYRLGKFVFDKHIGLAASVILAITSYSIYPSQEIRSYSLLQLFSIMSGFYLLKITPYIENKKNISRSSSTKYIVSSILMIYTHYLGLAFFFIQSLIMISYFIHQKISPRIMLLNMLIIISSFAFWLPLFLYQLINSIDSISWINPPTLSNVKHVLYYIFGNSKVSVVFFSICAAIAISIKILYLKKKTLQLSLPKVTVFLWAIIPIASIYFFSILIKPIFLDRCFSFCSPFIYLATASICLQFSSKKLYRVFSIGFIAIFLFYNLIKIECYYSVPQKEQFRSATQILKKKYSLKSMYPVHYCSLYKRYFEIIFNNQDFSPNYKNRLCRISDLERSISIDEKSFWLIYGHTHPDAKLINKLKENYNIVFEEKLIHAGVYHFQKISP